MRVTQQWAVLAAVLLAICSVQAEEPSWSTNSRSVKESMLARRSADAEAAKQEDVQGRNYAVHEQIYSNETEVNELVEQLITSRREGRILNDYDQVYADGNVDQALMQGDDMQARNLVRDKLCSLGLMSCETEGKRQYYSTIYAQGPPPPNKFGGGPYGPAKPMPPPGFYNGRPPMGPPPSSVNSFGPPRKVGYESSYKPGYRPSGPGGNYNGPYLESPPPSAIDGSGLTTFNKPPPGAIIYGSKPPGPVYSGNGASNKIPPYAFENPEKIHAAGSQQTNFYSHQSSASASQSSSTKVVVGGTVANAVSASAAGLQQHVHHHFHHVDGGDSAKVPTVPVPLGNGQTINTDFSALAQSSTAFNPQTSASFGGQSQNSYNAGFNAASQGGLLSQTSNGFKPNGLGSFGAGSSAGGAGSNGYGSTGFGSSGSNFNAGSNFASGTTGFGSSNAGYASGSSNAGYGSGSSSSSSYHSQNPSYYKKELQNFGGIQASSSNNFNSLTSGYDQSSYNNGAGYDTSRNQYVDCQCVPFNQCPAADRIGRKEDLILAIDPRNLGKDIEALSDEAAANITTNAMPEKKEDSATDDKKQEEEGEKKRSKREAEAAKDKQDEAADLPLDAEGRIFDNQGAIAAIQLVQRKILPTYGVSFGLPYPNNPAGYPSNVLGDHYPAQNPFFGAIGPNGLNLGLIHVNPLVSVQVQKTEFGEKVVKPLVNLHVTPNLNIFSKIGSLLKPKETLIENHHYHHHEHYTGFEHDHHHHEHHPEIITGPGPIYSEYKPEIITGHGSVHPYATDFKHYEVETYPSKPIFEYHSGPQIVSPEVHPIPSPIHDHPPHHHHHDHYPEHFGQHHQEHFENHDHQQHFVDNPQQQVEEHPPQHVEEQYPPHVEEHHPHHVEEHPAQHVVEHHQQHVEQHFQHHVEQHSSHNSYQSFSSSFPASGTDNGNHATGPSYPPSGTGSGGDGAANYPTGPSYPPSGNSGFGASNSYPPGQGYNTGYGGSAAGGSEIIYDRNSNGNQSLTFGQSQRNRKGKGLQIHNIPTQAPGTAEGSSYVTFPKDRRRRSVQDHEETLDRKSSVMADTAKLQERAYYGNRPVEKTCRVNEVCCRRPLRPVPPPQQFGRCGVRNAAGITGRIKNPVYVDGDSEFGEYPWHVAILKKDPKESIYACGATLIDAQHVITAAHCIKAQNGFDLRARLGEWDVNHDVEFFPYIERDVVSVHIHPEYYAGTLDNDLAVLKLDSPVDFSKNPHISPACLPDKYSDFTGARCWTTGWGKDAFGEHGKYQNILKEVDVPILSHHQCESQLRQTRLGYSYKLNPGFLCAGGEEGKDACKGDGGGPLVCERQGIWQVAGVVSWGIGCGQANVPGVYVKVSHYLDWIRQITQYYK